ncbi:MAG TPA: hypothetical protein DCS43_15700 [Verrucomicrobia bacterium]|nr:hypothetical protein [Verrucomicrobiota bacterium]
MDAGVNTASKTHAPQAAQSAPFRPASLVHKGKQEQVQGYRFPTRDYRQTAFYMITMSAHDRRQQFATCAENRTELTEDGRLVYALWQRMAKDYPQIALSTLVIMPDHLHGIVRVTEHMEKPIGIPLRAFKSQVTSALRKRQGNPELQVWAPGYHDWAVWRRGSLNAYIQYIRDNPRRYCLRKAHPDLFRRINDLRHARLPEGEPWTGYGNLFLLDKPELYPLQVSRRIEPEALQALREEMLDCVRNGGVLVSPFISPGEKDIAHAALDAGGAVILMKPDGFPPYFKPHGKYFDLCLQGRLLILACRPPSTAATTVTRDLCLAMNRWSQQIANPSA